ncbi:MAG: VWA domain-containing protein, partial [Chloroflexia bacterium]|nr:VWA domain-containing protein [Chloroflexia bacterium]
MKTIRTLLVLMFLSFGFGPNSLATAASQDTGSRIVNVEIIVDASGSMAAETNTGELRIDSAKRVLTEVINAIPEAEGVNVGLRVYGHLGDNTDEGRPESCVSSNLLVPIDGVNKSELLAQVDTLQPVGWTPIGYALEQASADFTQPAGDDVVNAIVMVTDGLETCDADPAAIAGDLRNSEAGITTHVIGFGTTPEEQAILSNIAEAGEGQLLGSDNTGQLLSALFEVLEELEVVEETGTGESRNSPLGVGRIGVVDDYEISVLSVTPNANDIVTADDISEPPVPGNQYSLVNISVTYVGATTGEPAFDLNPQAVGSLSTSYTTFNNQCGFGTFEGNYILATELFEGGSAEYSVCWQITSEDADSLVMYIESNVDFDLDPVWFALGNPIEETVDPESTPAPTVQASEDSVPTTAAAELEGDSSSTQEDSSRENPLAVGEVGVVDDYEISVLSVTPNADDIILADGFSEPP